MKNKPNIFQRTGVKDNESETQFENYEQECAKDNNDILFIRRRTTMFDERGDETEKGKTRRQHDADYGENDADYCSPDVAFA